MRSLATVALLAALTGTGCAARYVLGDSVLQDSRTADALPNFRVYVSNRTLTIWGRKELDTRKIGARVDDRSQKREVTQILTRNLEGGVFKEDLLNGKRRLWITFDPRCGEETCAYGFVQTEDGRYRMVNLPEKSDYDDPDVFRSCRLKRHKLRIGKLKSLADANGVYKLKRKRKRRPKTVFLEYKKKADDRIIREREKPPGLKDGRAPARIVPRAGDCDETSTDAAGCDDKTATPGT